MTAISTKQVAGMLFELFEDSHGYVVSITIDGRYFDCVDFSSQEAANDFMADPFKAERQKQTAQR